MFKLPVKFNEPVIVSVPIKVFEPVVAKLPDLAVNIGSVYV